MTRVQRSNFEKQIFILCKYNDEIKKIVQKAYDDYNFVYNETKLNFANFGRKYCEQILKNDNFFYDFERLPRYLKTTTSLYYLYRQDVLDKLYKMISESESTK